MVESMTEKPRAKTSKLEELLMTEMKVEPKKEILELNQMGEQEKEKEKDKNILPEIKEEEEAEKKHRIIEIEPEPEIKLEDMITGEIANLVTVASEIEN
eukprot:CAMPEP_0116891386 /NCGR_PEP_ID=MMETSP0467-20121206/1809_1 /TAXON_ID=283647 /ORGANISM="Mesodinium pulex, Strain SPMC105" /LENGTH=98 /DNA_ID=CAMNT_0004559863 /DNA_START=787 /DNA_END=1083 /DNA_ORIENTATION=-